MKSGILPTLALIIIAATSAQARDDCDVPIRDWKTREAVRTMAEDRGWTLRRTKIDDGCYEVYGKDKHGRRFEAKIDPATLKIVQIDDHDDDN
jgi:hypothetical protein